MKEKSSKAPKAPEVPVAEPTESTVIVPPGVEVKVSDPDLAQVKYLRVIAIRKMWRGKILHEGTHDYRIGGDNPDLTQEQIDAFLEESRRPTPGLSVSEISKFEPGDKA